MVEREQRDWVVEVGYKALISAVEAGYTALISAVEVELLLSGEELEESLSLDVEPVLGEVDLRSLLNVLGEEAVMRMPLVLDLRMEEGH